MNGSTARERIHRNMDAISIELDALDGLFECKKNINICIDRLVKSKEKARLYNKQLEGYCRQKVA